MRVYFPPLIFSFEMDVLQDGLTNTPQNTYYSQMMIKSTCRH
jgi:hypothetical protein